MSTSCDRLAKPSEISPSIIQWTPFHPCTTSRKAPCDILVLDGNHEHGRKKSVHSRREARWRTTSCMTFDDQEGNPSGLSLPLRFGMWTRFTGVHRHRS
jgi:hypothetical protein